MRNLQATTVAAEAVKAKVVANDQIVELEAPIAESAKVRL